MSLHFVTDLMPNIRMFGCVTSFEELNRQWKMEALLMRIFLIALALLPICAAGCAKLAPIPKTALKREPVLCTIDGESTCESGSTPKIRIALTNQTDSDIYLVRSLDASDCKWRYPHCYFEVIGPDDKPVIRSVFRCGNMNTLQVKDFAKIPPGGEFNPYRSGDDHGFFSSHQLSSHAFKVPGAYRIRFVYSSKSENINDWSGDGFEAVAANAEIKDMFRQVPKLEVRSEEFTLTVVAPSK